MKQFSDFAEEVNTLVGDKIKIEEVLGKSIMVIGYKIGDSKYAKTEDDKVLTLQFKLDNENRILFSGSKVLLEQCEKYKSEMPFMTKIEKNNKFYTFS